MRHGMPGLRSLKVFDAAARHRNFSRAADEVALTPAAVSHAVKEMEGQLGFALFSRTSRAMELTDEGAILHAAAVEALQGLDAALAKARRLSRGVSQLKLSMDPGLASKWMLPRLDSFHAAHPGVDLRFDISFSLRDFERDDVDAAIRFGKGVYPGLAADRLFDNAIVPVCSPRLIESGALKEPRDLLNHTLAHIEWTGHGVTWPNWMMWMAAAGVKGFDAERVLIFDDTTHAIQAAIDGNVVVLADFTFVAGDLSAGRLVRPFELGIRLPQEFGYFLVYPERMRDDGKVKAFRGWILDEARRAPQIPLLR